MASDLCLRGLYVAAVTPFGGDGRVARPAIEALAHRFCDDGAAGIVALGTTAESSALDPDERAVVVGTCAAVCAERGATLIVGAGTNNTAATVAAVAALAGGPAAATLVVVPYYVRPSERGVIEHFRAVAAASPVPVVVYNIPYRTGRGLGAASLLELAAVPNIAGVKQAVGGVDADTLELLAAAPEGFSVLGGDDAFFCPLVLMGGAGAISAAANVATSRFAAMIDCALAGKVDDARAISGSLFPLVRALFAEPNPAVIKALLHSMNLIPSPSVRLPLTAASAAALSAAAAAVARLGGHP